MNKSGILCLLLVLLCLSSCGVYDSKRTTELVSFDSVESLVAFMEERSWVFELSRVTGASVPTSFSAFGYDMTVAGEQLKCQLPFFGRAYRPTLDGKNPMNFAAPIRRYEVEIREGRKEVLVRIEVENEQHNTIRFICSVYPSGTMYVTMNSSDTESLAYFGHLRKPRE